MTGRDLQTSPCQHAGQRPFTPCGHCGCFLFPDSHVNNFELFDLKPRYFIDMALLQNKFYELSRVIHPDRFVKKSSDEMTAATQWTARLNTAFLRLKSSQERAEVLFSLAGFTPKKTKQSIPLELAEDFFSLQEDLEDDHLSDKEKNEKKTAFAQLITQQTQKSLARLESAMKEWEEQGTPLNQNAFSYFEKAAHAIDEGNYLASMQRNLAGVSEL